MKNQNLVTKLGLKPKTVWLPKTDLEMIQYLINNNKTACVDASDFIRQAVHDLINYEVQMNQKKEEFMLNNEEKH